ncbi:hypothetical protein AAG570_005450 [Ranatra chinensis]|uniref:Uncharacterized protein n=1 Tax=Ranatra chinensis TaxID=642074 RepID=A0ABD0YL34_9HEMI
MQWENMRSPIAKKFKFLESTKKIMASVFQGQKGIFPFGFVPREETINAVRYFETGGCKLLRGGHFEALFSPKPVLNNELRARDLETTDHNLPAEYRRLQGLLPGRPNEDGLAADGGAEEVVPDPVRTPRNTRVVPSPPTLLYPDGVYIMKSEMNFGKKK